MVFGAAVFLASCSKAPQGEWKPTGDGKTVIHSVTGEIRHTKTGLSTDETARREHNAPFLENARKLLGMHVPPSDGEGSVGNKEWHDATRPLYSGAQMSDAQIDLLIEVLERRENDLKPAAPTTEKEPLEKWMDRVNVGMAADELKKLQRSSPATPAAAP